MKRAVIGGLLCVVGLAGPAVAADLRATKGPVAAAPAAWDWSGGYIGLHGGYGFGSADNLFHPNPSYSHFAPLGSAVDQDVDGGVFGFHTGFNWQVGNVVFGLEGTTAWTSIDGKDSGLFATFPNSTYKTEVDDLSTFAARLGFANGPWLLYGKAGLAYGEITSTLTNGSRYFREKNDHIGWTAGVGLEYALTPNWILGVEYNYIDLGDQRYGGGNAGEFADYTSDITFSTVLARLSYKFGAGGNPLTAAILGPDTPNGLWNGLYLGIHGGYAWGSFDQTLWDGSLVAVSGKQSTDADGGAFGGQIGYMSQIGNWVLGTEAAFTWADAKSSTDVPASFLAANTAALNSTEINWLASVAIRVGYTWGPWQVYGKGGTALAEIDSKSTISRLGNTYSFSETNDHIGWTLGGGVEYAWGNWLLGVEYNYYDLGDQKYGGDSDPAGWLAYKNDVTFSSVLARVSYKFGAPAPVVSKY